MRRKNFAGGRIRRGISVILLSLIFAQSTWAGAPRLPLKSLPVPIVPQATSYSCGAAALLAVLFYWQNYEWSESALYPLLDTSPEQGTEPNKIAEAAKALGYEAFYRENLTIGDLREGMKRGYTMILDFQAWRDPTSTKPWSEEWENGHYGVLVGLDNEYAYFMDPSAPAGYAYMPLPELLERWHDYEDRRGYVWRYHNLGIFIRGEEPLRSIPAPLVPLE